MAMINMMSPSGRLIDVDGIPTYYEDAGEGLPLLLIHGSGPGIDGPLSWAPVLPALNARFRTINVDAPGYGESEMLKVRDTPENVARHFVKLLDHLAIEKVAAAGHSRGGRIAVELVAAVPERVSHLAIVCSGSAAPGGHVTENGQWTQSSVALVGYGVNGDSSYDGFKAALLTSLYNKDVWTDEMLRPAYDRFIDRRLDEWVERMKAFDPLQFYHVEDAEPFEAKVRAIAVPTVVVTGREDETGPWNRSLPLVEMIRDVEFHTLPFCGHFPQYDRPAALTALLVDFLTRTPELPAAATSGTGVQAR
jgi:pimeloyl-ACP methyl ester carboxylesterase